MMGRREGPALLGFLLVLAILCCPGDSLKCYSCINPVPSCTSVTNCSANFDSCLLAKAGSRVYHQCWKLDDCSFNRLSTLLGENQLEYSCCQRDLCNSDNSRPTLMGMALLLVFPLLATAWSL
ncbi:CD59 glycoprotein isoform X2 [Carlito syrichta]|nr:CD59 glycoprotein isoform X2 [Carlito syrichta]